MEEITKIKNLMLVLVAVLLFLNLLIKRKRVLEVKKSKVTIVHDTIWKTKVDTLKVQTIKYKKVYVHKNDITKIIKDTVFLNDTVNYEQARVYRDTLINDDFEIYSFDLVKGSLLDSRLSYKLKVPKEIITTKKIEYAKSYSNGMYLFSEVGGNSTKFDNLSIGIQYNRKEKWFASYRINLNELNQPTHNIGIGFRLFN
ncbi:hypothetical protein [Tenacibaculum xiamenense]|uniref:hypothetical protein n=1 Tax=Tenacibaculum xiamenense TaxID=1261553 RepID=UPI003892E092